MRATEHRQPQRANRREHGRRGRRGPHRHGAAARRTGGLAALAVAALLALGAPAAVTTAEAAPVTAPVAATVVAVAGPTDVVADEQVFVADANAARAALGLAPLVVDGRLTASARQWSSRMAAAGSISHDQNLAAGAGQPWTSLGENVGTGPSAAPVSAALLASPGHHANIVNAAFTKVGVGVVWTKDGLGRDVLWVTERFLGYSPTVTTAPAAPSTPSAPSPAAPASTTPPATASPTPTTAPVATLPTTTPTTAPAAADTTPSDLPTGSSTAAGTPTWSGALGVAAAPAPAAVAGSTSLELAPAAVQGVDGSFAATLAGSGTGLALFATLLLVGWALAVWPHPVDADDVASLPPAPSSPGPRRRPG